MSRLVSTVLALPAGAFALGAFAGFCFCLGVTSVGLDAVSGGRRPL